MLQNNACLSHPGRPSFLYFLPFPLLSCGCHKMWSGSQDAAAKRHPRQHKFDPKQENPESFLLHLHFFFFFFFFFFFETCEGIGGLLVISIYFSLKHIGISKLWGTWSVLRISSVAVCKMSDSFLATLFSSLI